MLYMMMFALPRRCFIRHHSYKEALMGVIPNFFSSYAVLKPVIDFEERLLRHRELERSIKQRGLKINLNEIQVLWNEYCKLRKARNILEEKRALNVEANKPHKGVPVRNSNCVVGDVDAARRIRGKIIREDLKNILKSLHSIESTIYPLVLNLPNYLHPNTVDLDETIYDTDVPKINSSHHLDIAKDLNILDYKSPFSYFLTNAGAVFELNLLSLFRKNLRDNNFVLFSNPDFCRSVILDGSVGVNHNNVFSLQEACQGDALYLTGGASIYPFLSFHIKHSISVARMPLKYFSVGRHYSSRDLADYSNGLYSVAQSSSVQMFITTSRENVDSEFNAAVDIVTQIYQKTTLPFRVLKVSAQKLMNAESLRFNFEVYSHHENKYFECGHLSLYDDYLSKKFNLYTLLDGEKEFPHVISGTIVKVPVLLSSYLEHYKNCNVQFDS